METNRKACRACGSAMQPGYATVRSAAGGIVHEFVVPSTVTAANPIAAFRQGLREGAAETCYALTGWRCERCGLVEWYAEREAGRAGGT